MNDANDRAPPRNGLGLPVDAGTQELIDYALKSKAAEPIGPKESGRELIDYYHRGIAPDPSGDGTVSNSTQRLIDHVRGVKEQTTPEERARSTEEVIRYARNTQKAASGRSRTQELIDHVRGVSPCSSAEPPPEGSSRTGWRLHDPVQAEWERKRQEELERLKDVRLSDVGIANEAPLDKDRGFPPSDRGPPEPTRGAPGRGFSMFPRFGR